MHIFQDQLNGACLVFSNDVREAPGTINAFLQYHEYRSLGIDWVIRTFSEETLSAIIFPVSYRACVLTYFTIFIDC